MTLSGLGLRDPPLIVIQVGSDHMLIEALGKGQFDERSRLSSHTAVLVGVRRRHCCLRPYGAQSERPRGLDNMAKRESFPLCHDRVSCVPRDQRFCRELKTSEPSGTAIPLGSSILKSANLPLALTVATHNPKLSAGHKI